MKKIKMLFLTIAMLVLSWCAFGGGGLFYIIFCIVAKIEQGNSIIFIIFTFVPMPFCWWLASKIKF